MDVRLEPMVLPQGLATPGHRLYTAREGDHRVGIETNVVMAKQP